MNAVSRCSFILVDSMSPFGHGDFNRLMVRTIAWDGQKQVTFFGHSKQFNEIPSDGVERIEIPEILYKERNNTTFPGSQHLALSSMEKILWRIDEVRRLWFVYKKIRNSLRGNRKIVFLTHDPLCLAVAFPLFRRAVIVIHDAGRLNSTMGSFVYFFLSLRFRFMFFESFQMAKLPNFFQFRSHVVPHPVEVLKSESALSSELSLRNSFVFAPSGSSVFGRLADLSRFLVNSGSGLGLIYKGPENSVSANVWCKPYFDRPEFERLMSECSLVLVPFYRPSWLRISNIINEAFARNKKVIASRNEYTLDLKYRYGDIIFLFEDDVSTEGLFALISNALAADVSESAFKLFIKEHSITATATAFAKMFSDLDGDVT